MNIWNFKKKQKRRTFGIPATLCPNASLRGQRCRYPEDKLREYPIKLPAGEKGNAHNPLEGFGPSRRRYTDATRLVAAGVKQAFGNESALSPYGRLFIRSRTRMQLRPFLNRKGGFWRVSVEFAHKDTKTQRHKASKARRKITFLRAFVSSWRELAIKSSQIAVGFHLWALAWVPMRWHCPIQP